MARRSAPPTAWQARWRRWRRAVMALLLVVGVVLAIFVSLGLGALVFAVTLGLATFSDGGPKSNGPTSPPSMPGTNWGG